MKIEKKKIELKGKEINYCDYYVSPKKEENEQRYGWGGCFCCGRPIKDEEAEGTLYIHYTTMGVLVDTLEEIKTNDILGESQGMFPIGSACAKKHSKKFIFVKNKDWTFKK